MRYTSLLLTLVLATQLFDVNAMNIQCHDYTNYFHAICNNCINCCKRLYSEGNNINTPLEGRGGDRPLHIIASFKNRLEIVQWLIDNNANVEEKNDNNETPLHIATLYSSIDFIKFLIQNKVNVNAQDKWKSVPLHAACKNDYRDRTMLLIHNGASLTIQNQNGDTPLHLLALNNNLELLKLIEITDQNNIRYLDFVNAINSKNKKNKKPSECTTNEEMREILQRYEIEEN